MNSQIQPIPIAVTPKSTNELLDWIDELDPEVKAIATTVMMMTWNLCAELTKDDL